MTKRLLRSVIEFDDEISPDNLVRNFERLRRAVDAGTITWGREEDEGIYNLIETFFIQNYEMPSATTVMDYFKEINRRDVVERVDDIRIEQPYARANFSNLLRTLQEDLARVKAFEVIKKTTEILSKGITDENGEVQRGLEPATQYFTTHMRDLVITDNQAQIFGDIRTDGDIAREEYERAESDQGRALGAISGIRPMDEACRGAKKGELWIHAAFPGELKTMLACNWAYNCVTRFKKNVVYVSFEMTREQIRRNILVQHSANARFAQQGIAPLDYGRIRDGELTKAEKEFYYDQVIPDFESNPNYTTFEVVTPDREWTMADVKESIERLHREFEVGLVILDHGQWIEARKGRRNKDYTIELNSVITDAKRMALNFDGNNGVPVVMLFQINRNGKTEADKNDGVYKMNALTYANNAEKTADVITTTYLNDELRRSNSTKFTNLKNRDNPLFAPFVANVRFACRRIRAEGVVEAEGMGITRADEFHSLMGNI
jgi:replicative DNA helicase